MDSTTSFENTDDSGFVLAASSGNLLVSNSFVHVPGFAADEGLIDLDLTSGFLEGARLHRKPNARGA